MLPKTLHLQKEGRLSLCNQIIPNASINDDIVYTVAKTDCIPCLRAKISWYQKKKEKG